MLWDGSGKIERRPLKIDGPKTANHCVVVIDDLVVRGQQEPSRTSRLLEDWSAPTQSGMWVDAESNPGSESRRLLGKKKA